jgi:hypothetical protein
MKLNFPCAIGRLTLVTLFNCYSDNDFVVILMLFTKHNDKYSPGRECLWRLALTQTQRVKSSFQVKFHVHLLIEPVVVMDTKVYV